MNNLNIFASASVGGGTYDKIKVFGSASINGDITANSINIFGSSSFKGKCDVKNISIHGSCKFSDNVQTEELDIKGSCKFLKELKVDTLKIYGAVKFEDKVYRSKLIEIYGSVKTATLEADKIVIEGVIECDETLNADLIEISTNARGNIKEMVGSKIVAQPKKRWFTRRRDGEVKVEIIEGDEIVLENVVCDLVRGTNVKIGPNCRIGRVEYNENLEVSPQSEVKDSEKI